MKTLFLFILIISSCMAIYHVDYTPELIQKGVWKIKVDNKCNYLKFNPDKTLQLYDDYNYDFMLLKNSYWNYQKGKLTISSITLNVDSIDSDHVYSKEFILKKVK